MCGIAGILNRSETLAPPSRETLHAMVSAIRYRGPDEYGIYRDHRCGLVHARLSLIDLTTGQQPLSNENGSLWIAFNGEIFNYVELREELIRAGHTFRTHSDTEVIVHAFETWGARCFDRLNGQWAVALWDSHRHELILSRDRVGVRPLFVHATASRIWFASEVKAIFADESVSRSVNPRGLAQTFHYWSSLAPTSLFEGIEEVRPGSVRTYGPTGTMTEEIFWRPTYPRRSEERKFASLAHATRELDERLREATRLRILRADVPVGSYLSGGLDSSLIAWMGRQAKDGDFRTFSLRFEDAEFDETPFQHAMAATIDSSHSEIVVSRADIARVFPEVVRHTERPILRTAPAPLYLLSKSVREAGIKAVLTGEGADEMLAGYDLFRETKVREFWSHDPASKARPRLFERLYPYLARSPQQARGLALDFWKRGLERAGEPGFSHDPRWSTTSALQRFFSTGIRDALSQEAPADPLADLPAGFREWDTIAQAQYLEVTTLLSGYLMSSQGDRMLMANSVEGRFPFLDAEVMEFCNALPMEYKLAGLNEKYILKRVAEGKIPAEIIARQKQPYRAPDAISFVGAKAPSYVADMYSGDALRSAGMFDPAAARGLYDKCQRRANATGGTEHFSNSDNMAFVGILSAQLMHDQIIRRSANTAAQLHYTTDIDRIGSPTITSAGSHEHI